MAIDNGSSSVRAGLFDGDGRPVGEVVKLKRTFQKGADGESELNPTAAIVQTRNAVDRVLSAHPGIFVRFVSFCAVCVDLCGLCCFRRRQFVKIANGGSRR